MDRLDSELAFSLAKAAVGKLGAVRWFREKSKSISSFEVEDYGEISYSGRRYLVEIVRFLYGENEASTYFLPLALSSAGGGQEGALSVSVDAGGEALILTDAHSDVFFLRWLFESIRSGRETALANGTVFPEVTPFITPVLSAEPVNTAVISSEQSNTSVKVDERTIYKSYRRLEEGTNPDYEMPLSLASTGFDSVPKPLARLEYRGAKSYTLGVLSEFVRNEGDCWSLFVLNLSELFASPDAGSLSVEGGAPDISCFPLIERLGTLTAELHNRLSSVSDDPAFSPVRITTSDVDRWKDEYGKLVDSAIRSLGRSAPTLDAATFRLAQPFLSSRSALEEAAGWADALRKGTVFKIRIHGDYHLGQVLKTAGGLSIIDFEGEPMRPLTYRRAPHCALRDVGGMLRSLDYAARFAALQLGQGRFRGELLDSWTAEAPRHFLKRYWEGHNPGASYLPEIADAFIEGLRFFMMEKAVYELEYELNNRPGWVRIPLEAIASLEAGSLAQTINNDFL